MSASWKGCYFGAIDSEDGMEEEASAVLVNTMTAMHRHQAEVADTCLAA